MPIWNQALTSQQARKDGAKPAEEWTRKNFQCFIDKVPELDKLTDGELRALFLRRYGRYDNREYFKRAHGLTAWIKYYSTTPSEYFLALTPEELRDFNSGDMQAFHEEAGKLDGICTDIWEKWTYVSAPQV